MRVFFVYLISFTFVLTTTVCALYQITQITTWEVSDADILIKSMVLGGGRWCNDQNSAEFSFCPILTWGEKKELCRNGWKFGSWMVVVKGSQLTHYHHHHLRNWYGSQWWVEAVQQAWGRRQWRRKYAMPTIFHQHCTTIWWKYTTIMY